ncbi:ABC transporter ATP-binding protein [Marivirga sp.]|uniref:ABC transporter ATP-binding protein n=1 Tax=Marivirga sp. TaxID=2018662 RepID=UPI002D7E5DC0|nr:ABC transporter ATP-binding protein [Marivirga sp.]HET8859958.1 ABC transporter ATP-binding protein [Marivirga sp.]
MKKEDIKSGNIIDTSVLKRLYKFVKPYQGRFYFLVFLTVTLAVLAPARPFVIQKAIDNQIAEGDFQGLINMTIILVGLLVLQAIVQYGHTYLSGWLGQYIIRDIRIKLYRHLLNLRLKFFDKTPIGRLVTRNVSDVESLSDVFSQGLAAMIGDILQILFILGMMFAMSWKLTLVSLATLPLLFISTYVFKEKVKVAFNEVRNAVSNLNSFVQEHVTGMSIVQIFTAEKREYEAFKNINNEHRRSNIRSVLYYSIYFPVAEVIQATGIGLLVWYGAKGVVNEAESGITLGMLIAFILYIQMFFRPIRLIADRFNTLQMGIVSSSRILNLLDNKENIPNNGDYKPEQIKGNISFQNIEFAYNEGDVVLKDISFSVEEGQSVALVGATGAGKSSVINLLSRFYDIQKGEITLDGRDIKEYDLYALRQNIGVVLQDVFLFSDTIFYNITLGNPNISLQQVKDAADLVGARKFIERLPGGYDYNVMERGATLSVGQRQLISFVRAVVYNPKIIVLDEATSSVDTETEQLIQNAIEKMMKGRTSIVIAHRLSTIQEADKIIVLDKGEIMETGTHQELLDQEGFYHQLHNMQYKEMTN